jgi:hypothetical protein
VGIGVQKKIISEADINAVLSSAIEELEHSDAMLQQRSEELIAWWIAAKIWTEETFIPIKVENKGAGLVI